jgi:hypothetical protein
MIPKAHVYSRKAIAILIAFLAGSVVFMAFDTTPPYEYDENASFVVPSPANDGDHDRQMAAQESEPRMSGNRSTGSL